jgi:hypothetical protein
MCGQGKECPDASRLTAKNRRGSGWLAGMVGARGEGEDIRDAAPLDTAELSSRSSAGFMLMSVWVLAVFLYEGTTEE